MASSSLRQLLEDRVSQLLADADRLAGDSCQLAVRDCADRLNQAVRRIRQAESLDELGAALVDSAANFAAGAALFETDGSTARLQKLHGAAEGQPPADFAIPLALAPALGGALETRDPVVAAAEPGEISRALVELFGHSPELRVSILPIVVADRVPGILYAWGNVAESALELLVQVAGAARVSLETPRPGRAVPLVNIAGAESGSTGASASWEALSPEQQRMHLRAQRYARVQVAQIRLFEAEAVQAGRGARDLYARLRDAIDAARLEFHEKFFVPCPGMLDYLHLELVRTLAHEDPELLGLDYPGPMV